MRDGCRRVLSRATSVIDRMVLPCSFGFADAQSPAGVPRLFAYLVTPILVLEVPLHGAGQSLLEAVAGLPAQFVGDPAGVNRVTPIVAGAVDHGLDQAGVWISLGAQGIQLLADGCDHFFVGPFPVAPYAVTRADTALGGGKQ